MTAPGVPRPDVVIIMTDEERAAPPYESDELRQWRATLDGRAWFDSHAVTFDRHYTGSLACVPSRPTLFTGHYPDVHGVTQTDGLGKMADDSRMRWMRPHEVPTLGNWFRAAGYDTHYDGKWHISHADLLEDGEPVPTNTADGEVLTGNVARYLEADPLADFGFSGWVGPEPHGGRFENSGLVRDPLIADRVVTWLEDRYARRRAGDAGAQRPFLLVASFVNPHDIVLFPLWLNRGMPEAIATLSVPDVPMSPSDFEDLRSKPALQVAYRAAYPTCYGPAAAVAPVYRDNHQMYRNLYYRLHAAVDGPIDRVRRAVCDGAMAAGSDVVLVRTADHGELLGAHGGLHQKWFQLYDESTRVPFSIARVGQQPTAARRVSEPTSHVDLVPTLLGAAGIDETTISQQLREDFSEVHDLVGTDLMPIVDGATASASRPVYLMTRDNMPEGDTGASGVSRAHGRITDAPGPLRINVPAHVATNVEGVVARPGGDGDASEHLWKLVRTFDDPTTWTEPGVRQLASDGIGGPVWRTDVLDDQWELYDLDADPVEMQNRASDSRVADVLAAMQAILDTERQRCVPSRHTPWPYATSQLTTVTSVRLLPPFELIRTQVAQRVRSRITQRVAERRNPVRASVPPPARLARRILQRLGLHPEDDLTTPEGLSGRRALVIATNHAHLDIGRPTGVFASELTVPYYAFADAGMDVDVASPIGGEIPVDPLSLKPAVRTAADDRFIADAHLREQLRSSQPITAVDMTCYDIVYLAGGWGAAFDLGVSEALGDQMSVAIANGAAIGGICHGPLGLLRARTPDGSPAVRGRHITAVTDKQIRELGIGSTPQHPERDLRAAGAVFESATARRDVLANHWVVDGRFVTGQNQNAGPMVARELMTLAAQSERTAPA